MSKITPSARRRKPGDVKNPSTIPGVVPADLDGTKIPQGIARSVPLGDPVALPMRFFLQLPPGSATAIAAVLDAKCEEFARNRNRPVYGVYVSKRKLALAAGLSESTIRTVALPWLVEQGWVELQEFTARGHLRTMIWLKWRFPDPAGGIEAGEPEVPVHARMAQKSAPVDARISVDTSSNELNEETKKTTDGGSSSFVQVPEKRGPEAILAPPIPPPPAPAPAPVDHHWAELLDQAVPDEARRLEVAAKVPAWVARYGLGRVMLAIREAKARIAKGAAIDYLPGYIEGILRDWAKKPAPTPRACKAEADREAAEAKLRDQERRRAADKDRQRRKDEAERLADAAKEERWAALPEDRKQEIRAAAERSDPRMWRQPIMRLSMCIERMLAEEGA